jgi:hypothetical protein
MCRFKTNLYKTYSEVTISEKKMQATICASHTDPSRYSRGYRCSDPKQNLESLEAMQMEQSIILEKLQNVINKMEGPVKEEEPILTQRFFRQQ